MSLDVRKIRYFIALFEEGSVNRAAERENIVQPALSTQLKQLEQDLSIQLFERSAQGLQPTRAGQHFYRLCLGLTRELRAARQEMLDFGTSVRGAIHVGMMTSICHGCFGQTLMRYCEAHPDVHVTIVEGTSGILADRVVLGTLDFAVCNRPASHTGLKLRKVFSDKFFLVSGRAKGLVPGRAYDLAKLPSLKLVLPSPHNFQRRWLERSIKADTIRPTRTIEIDGLGATLQFIEASDWSALLPRVAVAREIGTSRFLINRVSSPDLASDIYEMHPPDRPLSVAGERLVEAVQRDLLELAKGLP